MKKIKNICEGNKIEKIHTNKYRVYFDGTPPCGKDLARFERQIVAAFPTCRGCRVTPSGASAIVVALW